MFRENGDFLGAASVKIEQFIEHFGWLLLIWHVSGLTWFLVMRLSVEDFVSNNSVDRLMAVVAFGSVISFFLTSALILMHFITTAIDIGAR